VSKWKVSKHKHDELRACKMCEARGSDEDDGPVYEHRTHSTASVRVACGCGNTTAWCSDMDHAWEAWASMNQVTP
jgi:hypothetical protein